jgi:hypothetical protein
MARNKIIQARQSIPEPPLKWTSTLYARCLGVHDFVIICCARVSPCHFVCRMHDTFFFLPCCFVGQGDSSQQGRGLRRFNVMGVWPLMTHAFPLVCSLWLISLVS